jgi:hypothetical protein
MMAFSNQFVLSVLVDGNIQEELSNGEVHIPFGEYALRLRNRNSRRAVVKIFIDGENVSEGGYVVEANDHVDIYRHANRDRAFKFVSLDSQDAKDAGKGWENKDKTKGTIEARFYLERFVQQPYKVLPQIPIKREDPFNDYEKYPWGKPSKPWPKPYEIWCSSNNELDNGQTPYKMSHVITRGCSQNPQCPSTVKCSSLSPQDKISDGCTVEGGMSGQTFGYTTLEVEEQYTSIKLYLQGCIPTEYQIVYPGIYCSNCGIRLPKANQKIVNFCNNCGIKIIK